MRHEPVIVVPQLFVVVPELAGHRPGIRFELIPRHPVAPWRGVVLAIDPARPGCGIVRARARGEDMCNISDRIGGVGHSM